jgi:hypothetical protein
MAVVISLYEYHVGHCPLFEAYLMYTTFRELVLLSSSGYYSVTFVTNLYFNNMDDMYRNGII